MGLFCVVGIKKRVYVFVGGASWIREKEMVRTTHNLGDAKQGFRSFFKAIKHGHG